MDQFRTNFGPKMSRKMNHSIFGHGHFYCSKGTAYTQYSMAKNCQYDRNPNFKIYHLIKWIK